MKGLLTSLITVLTFTGLQAQSLAPMPKVVIGLTIDQLRTDYIEAFSSLYGERGFKRLWKEGHVFRNAEYSFSKVDRASAIAAIYTGTTPSVNGIISNQWMDPKTLRTISCVDDPAFMGNYTDESSSPAQLLTSTLADELKITTRNRGLVYAVAPFRDAAIFAAGHSGDGAYWINNVTGKWCGTTYYKEFPWWIGQYNDQKGIDLRISNMTWTPVHPVEKYTFLPDWRDIAFKYKLDDDRSIRFKRLISSPFVNDEVNMMVETLLEKSYLGKDDIPDLLSLTYFAGNYANKNTQECAMEIQDTYVRLDHSIADLLDLIEKKIGLHNVVFFITSTGYTAPESPDLGLYRVPGGQFYLNRCAALLNMYLTATYGAGQYVEAYYDQQIYLNHELIEKKQFNLAEIQDKAANFLIQFSGVNEVYSAHRLLLGAWTPDIHRIRNGYHRKRSGDLVIEVLPGWTAINENQPDERFIRSAYTPAPLIFLGNSVKPAIVQTPVAIEHIAPTVANFVRIRAPNACKLAPLTGIR